MLKNKTSLLISILNTVAYTFFIFFLNKNIVPTHYNIYGTADRFSNKWSLIIFALIPLALAVAFTFYKCKSCQKNNPNKKSENKILLTMTIFFIIISWLFALIVLKNKYQLDVKTINAILICVGILALNLGHIMPEIKQNRFLGVRTPWTLKNETVWNKTHEFAGVCTRIGGNMILITACFSLVTNLLVIGIIGLILGIILISIVPIVYSYISYKNTHK